MIIYPNYTFFVPDKRLYTLYKGITVTPRLVQASSVSSYSQATFTRGASCLCFVRRPFTRPALPRVTAPLRRGRGYRSRRTFGAEPAHDSAPTALGFRRLAWIAFPCASECTRHVVLQTHSHLQCRRSASFGIAEGESCSCETTLT
jgi:hypothetical protein